MMLDPKQLKQEHSVTPVGVTSSNNGTNKHQHP